MTKLSIITLASILTFAFATSAHATVVKSEKTKVDIARVVEVVTLVKKPGLQVSVVVQDLGGSTDVSPTQKVYLTLYAKGEMFSTDAAFPIANINALVSAKRVSAGVYSITTNTYTEGGMAGKQTFTINAAEALTALKNVTCSEDFDCQASTNFASQVEVTVK